MNDCFSPLSDNVRLLHASDLFCILMSNPLNLSLFFCSAMLGYIPPEEAVSGSEVTEMIYIVFNLRTVNEKSCSEII
jgi:hypothetical protein